MKLLLDENLPKRLKEDFPDHEVSTIRDRGWNGKRDGEIILLLEKHGFDAFLTFDKNMRYQQNFRKAKIAVLILSAKLNSYESLTKLSPTIQKFLKKTSLPKGPINFSLT